jgi:hypothetical protein
VAWLTHVSDDEYAVATHSPKLRCIA